MEPEINPEQKAHLNSWAGQRDAILLEISGLKTDKADLQKVNIELLNSNKDVEDRMNVVKGRIEELQIKEKELPEKILKEIASLQSQKSTLEAEIPLLKGTIKILSEHKDSLEKEVASELKTFESIKGNALSLEKVVSHVTEVSEANEKRITSISENLIENLEKIVEVNKKNVEETNYVLDKLPKMMVDLQRRGLISRVTK
jgi:chromosome segregation ATPase